MPAQPIILDGRAAAAAIKDGIAAEVKKILASGRRAPHLAAVLVGNDGASEAYVGGKVKACGRVGFRSTLLRLPQETTEQELLATVKQLNDDAEVDGFIVQLPLPDHISETKVTEAVRPEKDVDGFHPVNVGRMVLGLPAFFSATPFGIMLLLQRYGVETAGRQAVVIGRSNIVGRPVSILLSRNAPGGNATVTLCHSKTKNLKELCARADIIVAALGRPEFLTADMVKDSAVVVDVGISRVEDKSAPRGYVLKGDVKFGEVAPRCSFITPVPGGVGPMTIAALLKNTLLAAQGDIY